MPTVELNVSAKVWPKLLATLVCEPGKSETTYWDAGLPGFGLRCRSSGVRVCFCQYRTKTGEMRKHTLGDPKNFAKARKEAERLLDGTGWLPEPFRLASIDAPVAAGGDVTLPAFLIADEAGDNAVVEYVEAHLAAAE